MGTGNLSILIWNIRCHSISGCHCPCCRLARSQEPPHHPALAGARRFSRSGGDCRRARRGWRGARCSRRMRPGSRWAMAIGATRLGRICVFDRPAASCGGWPASRGACAGWPSRPMGRLWPAATSPATFDSATPPPARSGNRSAKPAAPSRSSRSHPTASGWPPPATATPSAFGAWPAARSSGRFAGHTASAFWVEFLAGQQAAGQRQPRPLGPRLGRRWRQLKHVLAHPRRGLRGGVSAGRQADRVRLPRRADPHLQRPNRRADHDARRRDAGPLVHVRQSPPAAMEQRWRPAPAGRFKSGTSRAASCGPRCSGHRNLVFGLSLTKDGKTLVSAGWDTVAKVWDVNGVKELHALPLPPVSRDPTAAISRDVSLARRRAAWPSRLLAAWLSCATAPVAQSCGRFPDKTAQLMPWPGRRTQNGWLAPAPTARSWSGTPPMASFTRRLPSTPRR